MSIEKARISFYNITQCAYFARGDETALFGSVQEVLEDLQAWSNGKKLIETKVSEINESDSSGNTYLLDIHTRQDTWLITTWNETASTDGQVASVQAESNVGEAEIHMNGIAEGSIPGYATYFWVIPTRNIFASIRFQHPYTAQKPFRAYVNKFMECHGRHVVVGDPEPGSDYPILGYINGTGDTPRHAYARFRTELLRNPGQKQFMLDNIHRITKIVRKETLNLSESEHLSLWQKLLRQANLSAPQALPIEPHISYDVPFRPTIEDINNLFLSWEENTESEWDDFGVKISGDQNIHWVSHTFARKEFELNIERDNLEVVNSESLIDAVLNNRNHILAVVPA